jgi:hypothetical protein
MRFVSSRDPLLCVWPYISPLCWTYTSSFCRLLPTLSWRQKLPSHCLFNGVQINSPRASLILIFSQSTELQQVRGYCLPTMGKFNKRSKIHWRLRRLCWQTGSKEWKAWEWKKKKKGSERAQAGKWETEMRQRGLWPAGVAGALREQGSLTWTGKKAQKWQER